ncbi:putative quinol monooxygenase [Saccharopolyspora spinosa]|uniref:Antibiotic biosynthesis monooxygenase n=1 Tax=Saccharopolyspora spinosa TaxID=60894 RepID=A0A2N3XRK2_SACSN|nr:antibiotic biosynthesis monooxygenase [Saccharopolyspora spinosa]PKW13279.1 antibiotic biosynthesis monooxygenase [Saccharopolyspora spinosa]
MTVGMIAFHYPRPAHFDEFVARVHRVRDAFLGTPGCMSADVWTTPDDEAVVSTVTWESDEAFAASFAAVKESAGDDIVFDERESRAREITTLRSR